MKQNYKNYQTEHFQVWKILFERQLQNLKNKGSREYLACLEQMKPVLHSNKIPDFNDLNKLLSDQSGWQIEVVKGLIPVDDFFHLLSQKKFCSSTWVRQKSQLDYLEEPDMFHDIFGHIPLLLNREYSNFTLKLGQLGVKYKHSPEILLKLQRIYWFTIEFGLIKENNALKCYGAGLISSFGETNHVFTDRVNIEPFDILEVVEQEFVTDQIQNRYRLIESYEMLFNALEELETIMEAKQIIR